MGAYLSEPNINKDSIDEDNEKLSFGASSMQGWRLDQEDAHNSIIDFDKDTNTSFFAVYDGHGGSEVAAYCAKYLPTYLRQIDEYKAGHFEEALKKLFLKFDESLLSQEAQKELMSLREMVSGHNSIKNEDGTTDKQAERDKIYDDNEVEYEEEEEHVESETAALYDEACMPIEEVLKRYTNTECKVRKALRKKGMIKPGPSPMINAPGSSSSATAAASLIPGTPKASTNSAVANGKPIDFAKQEELDINEIKQNSHGEVTATPGHDPQDYDEASNLGDVTDSQRSTSGCDQSSLHSNETLSKSILVSTIIDSSSSTTTATTTAASTSTVIVRSSTQHSTTTLTKPILLAAQTAIANLSADPNTPSKTKLNKEEIKLSPIQKKSLSCSSLLENSSSVKEEEEQEEVQAAVESSSNSPGDTTVNNENKNAAAEENKENTTTPKQSQSGEVESVKTRVKAESCDNGKDESAAINREKMTTELVRNLTQGGGGISSKSNLFRKFLASCVKTKLKEGLKGMSSKKNENEENGDEEEEDDEDNSDELDEDSEEDDDSDETEDDDDDNDDDDDDDDEDEDEEDENIDEEGEEDDDEEDYDSTVGMGGESRPGYDSGCTAVVALLANGKDLYVANAGDSRCVVSRDGKAVDMSVDHKPEDEEERNRIQKAGGHVTKDGRVNNGLNLSRAIGDHSYKKNQKLPLSEQMITSLPDILRLEVDPSRDKFMILACDGIWNFMSSQEVVDYVGERLNSSNYTKLSQICEELFMHCLAPDSDGDGTGCDNMTCILITFQPFRHAMIRTGPSSLLVAQNVNTSESTATAKATSADASEKVNNLKRSLENNGNEENLVESKLTKTAYGDVNDENSPSLNGSKKMKSSDEIVTESIGNGGSTIGTDNS